MLLMRMFVSPAEDLNPPLMSELLASPIAVGANLRPPYITDALDCLRVYFFTHFLFFFRDG